ncbi:hypothetical protein RJ639_005814 [Escallonia herrerae]|uniref:Uncharacterized protein n=1 Tax=Escallonia herrerae TaxID=1293975 RepID=A0AA88VZ42_9ASTE|nr:hypothetical protein RJ639_005814 [Escallonia herrerae]
MHEIHTAIAAIVAGSAAMSFETALGYERQMVGFGRVRVENEESCERDGRHRPRLVRGAQDEEKFRRCKWGSHETSWTPYYPLSMVLPMSILRVLMLTL